jgi:hypothetical protein
VTAQCSISPEASPELVANMVPDINNDTTAKWTLDFKEQRYKSRDRVRLKKPSIFTASLSHTSYLTLLQPILSCSQIYHHNALLFLDSTCALSSHNLCHGRSHSRGSQRWWWRWRRWCCHYEGRSCFSKSYDL